MKLTKEETNNILSELYTLDPALREYEGQLIKLIDKLSAVRPEVRIDEAFVARLRQELESRTLEQKSKISDKSNFIYLIFNPIHMKKVIYAAAGAALAIMIVVPVTLKLAGVSINKLIPSVGKPGKLAFETTITRVAGSAFGVLGSSGSANQVTAESTKSSVAAPLASGRGGGGGGDAAVSSDAKMGIMPIDMTNYRFTYKGAEITAPEANLPVLKRQKGSEVSVNMSDLLNGLNFGLLDLGGFADLEMQNITLQQKQDFGYMINVFPDEGSVNIYQAWETWPTGKCFGDTACFERERVAEADMPSDEEAIAIADAFMTDHNIDLAKFGKPELQYNWRVMYQTSTDKANYYFPEMIDVVYPLVIDGKFVYDEFGGMKQGISVQVHIKSRKAAGLYGLTTQNYEASDYAMETDVQKLISYAERGGVNNYQYGEAKNTVELELGDPELAYIRSWIYTDNQNSELLVPALVFPITNPPTDDTYFNRKSVIIPLASEILKERLDSIQGEPGRPMPLIEPAVGGAEPAVMTEPSVGSGVSGSAGSAPDATVTDESVK